MAENRIYIATSVDGRRTRLIDCANQPQGYRHIARQEWTMRPATARDMLDCQKAGIEVEAVNTEAADANHV